MRPFYLLELMHLELLHPRGLWKGPFCVVSLQIFIAIMVTGPKNCSEKPLSADAEIETEQSRFHSFVGSFFLTTGLPSPLGDNDNVTCSIKYREHF